MASSYYEPRKYNNINKKNHKNTNTFVALRILTLSFQKSLASCKAFHVQSRSQHGWPLNDFDIILRHPKCFLVENRENNFQSEKSDIIVEISKKIRIISWISFWTKMYKKNP